MNPNRLSPFSAARSSLAGAALSLAVSMAFAPAALAASNAPAAAGSSPAASTPAAPVLPKLSAQQVVEKNIAARGGLAAWKSVQSISYSGTLDAGKTRPDNGLNPGSKERLLEKPGKSTKIAQSPEEKSLKVEEGTPISLPYTLYMQRPNKQRVEVKFKDETLVQVYDGKSGWKLQPYLRRGGALPFSEEEMKKAKQFQDIDGPLVDYAAKGTKIALDGTDLVDGRPAYRLKLTLKSGDVRRVWVDGQTFLDVQIDGTRRVNGHPVAEYTAMRDFRDVSGIKVPYVMETRTEGLPEREKIVVEKVALNPKLDNALFGKPN
jgi:hypothetical protein